MRYQKSDFTLVPSRQARIGMPANQQVVYMWLCEHSNDNNQSFPSRKVLAYECGVSPSTLDRAINELVDKGFIIRQTRFNQNKQVSNLYTVFIVNKGSQNDEGGVFNMTSPPIHIDEQNQTHRTKPNRTLFLKKDESPETAGEDSEASKLSDYTELQPELDSFMEMRKAIKKPLTPRGLEIIIGKLRKFHPGDTHSQKQALDTATAGSYLLPVAVKGVAGSAADPLAVRRMLHPEKYGDAA